MSCAFRLSMKPSGIPEIMLPMASGVIYFIMTHMPMPG